MSANNSPQECPNGCGPMWRLTERQAGNEAIDRMETMQDEINTLRRCVENFADPKNWDDRIGCLRWNAKRHAIDYAEAALDSTKTSREGRED